MILCGWLGLALLVAAGCGGFEDERGLTPLGIEKKIILYSPHGKEILTEFKTEFEKAWPGTTVEYLYISSQQCLERIRNEKRSPMADIWWGAGHPTFMTAAEEGLLEAFRPSWADKADTGQHDPKDLWYATFLSPEIIFYNRDLVAPEEAPKDWKDLADPRWKGKILLRYPIPSDTMRAIFFGMIHQSILAHGNENSAFEWMRALHGNTREYLSGGELLFRKMAQRVGSISVWTLSDIKLQASRYQYPFETVFPESGCPVLLDGIALLKGAPHPKAAQALYEFVTSSTSAIRLAGTPYYRIPTRTDLPHESLPDWMHDLRSHSMTLDWNLYRSRMNDWMHRWEQEIRGQAAE